MDQDSSFKDETLLYLENYIEKYFEKNPKLAIVSPFHETVLSDGNYPDPESVDKPIIVMTSSILNHL